MHWVEAELGAKNPGLHGKHCIAPATALNVPAAHAVCWVWPAVGTKNPGEASTHAPPEKYFPAGHGEATGTSQLMPVNPTMQEQVPLPPTPSLQNPFPLHSLAAPPGHWNMHPTPKKPF
jgi:hypothetical protein